MVDSFGPGHLRSHAMKLDVFGNNLQHDFVEVVLFRDVNQSTKVSPAKPKVWPHLMDAEGFFVACFSKDGLAFL